VEGPALLLAVVGLGALAGMCVASWGYAERPAEATLAWLIATVSIWGLPIHVLGWCELLTRVSVVGSIAGVSVAIIAGTWFFARERMRATALSIGRFVRDGVLVPWRERSFALVGLAAVLVLCAWTAWLAYLAPSSAWDGIMYHEPMVGFALQNRGFAWVGPEDVNAMLAQADGYPRASENLMLFFVVLWDRRLIDLLPSVLVPILLVGMYVLTRRFVASRVTALGLATGFVLLPAIMLQLRSTYVDVTIVVFLAAAAAFLCKPSPSAMDVWLGGLCLGFTGASKVTGLVVVPLAGAVGLAIVITAAIRNKKPRLALHLLGAILLMLGIMAPTFARNWVHEHNLFWPGHVRIEGLGIDWAGPLEIRDMNVSDEQDEAWFFGPPVANQQFHDTKDNGYGNIPPFLIPPLALIGFLLALYRAVTSRERAGPIILLGLTLPLIATWEISPATHWARLNLHIVLAVWLLAAYAVGSAKRRLLGEGVTGALVVGALMTLYWSEPAWDVDRERASRLAMMSPLDRAASRDHVFTLLPDDTARARELELGDGDLVVVADHPWVGLLWNERFSNRVEIMSARRVRSDEWVARARAMGAEWVVVASSSGVANALGRDTSWSEDGPADGNGHYKIFRRASAAQDAAASRAPRTP
jgi:hypothetical protein